MNSRTRCENGLWVGSKYVICSREGTSHIHFPRGKMWVCGNCFDNLTVIKKIKLMEEHHDPA